MAEKTLLAQIEEQILAKIDLCIKMDAEIEATRKRLEETRERKANMDKVINNLIRAELSLEGHARITEDKVDEVRQKREAVRRQGKRNLPLGA